MSVKKYSSEELAVLVKQLINKKFETPEKVKTELDTNIKRKIVTLYKPKKLTDNEIEKITVDVSQWIYENLDRITKEFIENTLSNEIVSKSRMEGIEIVLYKEYFNELATDLVKKLLDSRYKDIKSQLAKARRQNR